jgi:hypothetical protein
MSNFLTWLFLPPQLPLPLCQLPQLSQLSTLKLPLLLLIKFFAVINFNSHGSIS